MLVFNENIGPLAILSWNLEHKRQWPSSFPLTTSSCIKDFFEFPGDMKHIKTPTGYWLCSNRFAKPIQFFSRQLYSLLHTPRNRSLKNDQKIPVTSEERLQMPFSLLPGSTKVFFIAYKQCSVQPNFKSPSLGSYIPVSLLYGLWYTLHLLSVLWSNDSRYKE